MTRILGKLEAGQQEVHDDDGADEAEQDQEQLALLDHVGFAGLVNQLGDLRHRAVHRQVLHVRVAQQTEEQSQDADHQAREQDLMPGEAEEVALIEVGQPKVHLATRPVLGAGHGLGHLRGEQPEAPPARAPSRGAGPAAAWQWCGTPCGYKSSSTVLLELHWHGCAVARWRVSRRRWAGGLGSALVCTRVRKRLASLSASLSPT